MTDILLAVFTGLLVLATGFLAYIAYRQQDTMKMTQRAYVKMSHSSSLTFDPATGEGSIDIAITNDGLTPAQIIDMQLVWYVLPPGEKIPAEPDYGVGTGQSMPQAFLVAKDQYTHHLSLQIDPVHAANVINGNGTLLIYGYVDYADKFGQKHRGGYGRVYNPNPQPERSNLGFVNVPGYNYDKTISG